MIIYKFRQANNNSRLAKRNSNIKAERKILIISVLIAVSNLLSWFPSILSAMAAFVSYTAVAENMYVLNLSAVFCLFLSNQLYRKSYNIPTFNI